MDAETNENELSFMHHLLSSDVKGSGVFPLPFYGSIGLLVI